MKSLRDNTIHHAIYLFSHKEQSFLSGHLSATVDRVAVLPHQHLLELASSHEYLAIHYHLK